MRTIKYRGKNTNGEWLYGDLLQVANEVFIAPSDGDWFDFIPWSRNNVFHLPAAKYAVIPETVGQFTGLHDKNGKEIYEGDIVRFDNHLQRVSSVLYDSGQYTVESKTYSTALTYRIAIHAVVIGNIHDNPELLNL